MIHNNILLAVKDENHIDEVGGLLREQGRLSRQEPGCARFEVYHSRSDPKVFILVEWWASSEALDVHRTAKAYTEIYKPKVLPLVERTAHPSSLVE